MLYIYEASNVQKLHVLSMDGFESYNIDLVDNSFIQPDGQCETHGSQVQNKSTRFHLTNDTIEMLQCYHDV